MAKKGGNIFQRILQLVLDRTSVEKTRRETQDALKGATDPKVAQKNLGLLGKSFQAVRASALAFVSSLLGAVGVVAGLRKLIRESSEAQKVQAQQEAVLRSTGMAAGRTAQQLQKQADALQQVTTFSDETVASAQNLLLTFTKIRGENFDQAVETTLDLATALGTDASNAALQLGKALQDPLTGLTALRRAGVSFSESQRELVKELVETNRLADAQKLILKELEIQFGGSAEAARNTLGGALEGLANQWGELFEVQRGGTSDTVKSINKLTEWIAKFDDFAERASAKLAGMAERVREMVGLTGDGPSDRTRGFLEARRQQALDDARAADARQRELEEEAEARAQMAEAEAERQKAAREAALVAQREREAAAKRHIELLIEAHEIGKATLTDNVQLQAIHAAVLSELQAGNVALERRLELTKLAAQIESSLPARPSMLGRMQGAGALNAQGAMTPSLGGSGDVTAQAENQAGQVQSAWSEAFQSIGLEAQAAGVLIDAVFGASAGGFLASLADLAKSKVKQNLAQALEAAATGLAQSLLFHDPVAAAAGFEAAKLHTAAAAAWGGIAGGAGAAGGGGAAGGNFAGFSPGRATPGAAADRSVPGPTAIYKIFVDPFDVRNGIHQQKVGQAVVLWNQRSGGDQ